MAHVVFFLVAALAVGSALGLIAKKNPIHGALFLVVNLASIAVFYLMLGAEFLALAQVIVYAGAIMVLFVFAIMVLIPGKEETGPDPHRGWRVAALPVGGVLLVLLVVTLVPARMGTAPPGGGASAGSNLETLGRLLFTDYLFPFELTSLLLLAAMVGVLVLARRKA
jgi:NADH-quinone oxidoreductase subunit J